MSSLPEPTPPEPPSEPQQPENLAKLIERTGVDPGKALQIAQLVITANFRTSLVPNATEMVALDQAIPGAGSRILASFEHEGEHRRTLQKMSREAEITEQVTYRRLEEKRLNGFISDQAAGRRNEKLGLWLGLAACALALSAAIFCLWIAPNFAGAAIGAAIGLGGITSIVRLLVGGRDSATGQVAKE